MSWASNPSKLRRLHRFRNYCSAAGAASPSRVPMRLRAVAMTPASVRASSGRLPAPANLPYLPPSVCIRKVPAWRQRSRKLVVRSELEAMLLKNVKFEISLTASTISFLLEEYIIHPSEDQTGIVLASSFGDIASTHIYPGDRRASWGELPANICFLHMFRLFQKLLRMEVKAVHSFSVICSSSLQDYSVTYGQKKC